MFCLERRYSGCLFSHASHRQPVSNRMKLYDRLNVVFFFCPLCFLSQWKKPQKSAEGTVSPESIMLPPLLTCIKIQAMGDTPWCKGMLFGLTRFLFLSICNSLRIMLRTKNKTSIACDSPGVHWVRVVDCREDQWHKRVVKMEIKLLNTK